MLPVVPALKVKGSSTKAPASTTLAAKVLLVGGAMAPVLLAPPACSRGAVFWLSFKFVAMWWVVFVVALIRSVFHVCCLINFVGWQRAWPLFMWAGAQVGLVFSMNQHCPFAEAAVMGTCSVRQPNCPFQCFGLALPKGNA